MNTPNPLPDNTQQTPGVLLQQFRQMSIPPVLHWTIVFFIGALIAGLLLAIAVIGWVDFAGQDESIKRDWLTPVMALLGAIFLPSIAVVAILFAETGTESLRRRTDEILDKSIREAFSVTEPIWGQDDETVCIRSARITVVHSKGSPSARYNMIMGWGTATESRGIPFSFFIDLNVYKVNVGLVVPNQGEFCGDEGAELFEKAFGNTLAGARHAGYDISFSLPSAPGEARHFSFVARRILNKDFLVDPAEKLHFIFDLRNFVFAFASDLFSLRSQAADDSVGRNK